MISLCDALPESVEVEGRDYSIYTDFWHWIRFEKLLDDNTLDDTEKLILMLEYYKDERPPSTDEAILALSQFLCGGEDIKSKLKKRKPAAPKATPIYDFEQDASLIFAAFKQAYGINLFRVKTLHWWEFQALMEGLPEGTKLSRVMEIRAMDISKMPSKQRQQYEKLKKLCAIGKKNDAAPQSLEDRDAAMREKAKRAMERVRESANSD